MRLSPSEIKQTCGNLPDVLNVKQAAEAIGVPVKTIYEWSSQGRLEHCAKRRGKRLLIHREKFVEVIFNGSEW